jgi:hypothetical protein
MEGFGGLYEKVQHILPSYFSNTSCLGFFRSSRGALQRLLLTFLALFISMTIQSQLCPPPLPSSLGNLGISTLGTSLRLDTRSTKPADLHDISRNQNNASFPASQQRRCLLLPIQVWLGCVAVQCVWAGMV